MPETHYPLAVIRAAFWATFNESGEHWFSYFGTPEENSSCTEGAWDGNQACEGDAQMFHKILVKARQDILDPETARLLVPLGTTFQVYGSIDCLTGEYGGVLFPVEINEIRLCDEQH